MRSGSFWIGRRFGAKNSSKGSIFAFLSHDPAMIQNAGSWNIISCNCPQFPAVSRSFPQLPAVSRRFLHFPAVSYSARNCGKLQETAGNAGNFKIFSNIAEYSAEYSGSISIFLKFFEQNFKNFSFSHFCHFEQFSEKISSKLRQKKFRTTFSIQYELETCPKRSYLTNKPTRRPFRHLQGVTHTANLNQCCHN